VPTIVFVDGVKDLKLVLMELIKDLLKMFHVQVVILMVQVHVFNLNVDL